MIIYGLIDPRTNQIRYIGKSDNPPPHRLKQHIKDAKRGEQNHRCNWLRKLLSLGLRPTIHIIEECSGDGVAEEIFHIALGRSDGLRLTNSTAGGEGMFNPTPELRKRMSIARTGIGHSEDSKKKIGEISRAVWAARTDEQRKAFGAKVSKSKTGWVPSDETRRKMSEAKKGKAPILSPDGLRRLQESRKRPWSEAQRQKMRQIMTGRKIQSEWRQKMSAAKKGKPLRRFRRFDDAEESVICAEYNAGGITKQIAAGHGVTHYLITSILRRHGIPARPHSLLPHQIEKMRIGKTGKKQSAEHIAKRTAATRGKPKSIATVQKMRESQSSPKALARKSESGKRRWEAYRAAKSKVAIALELTPQIA